jgi:ABC-2 type transport system permease protein/oleandomycin transport system permease protein
MNRLLPDTLTLAERNLVRLPRSPDLLIGFTIQPIMFVLLFAYVFGGAIETPGFDDYIDFLIPGIITQNIAFGGFVTALGLAEDMTKGLIDRFRSLPTARASVLAGRALADVATNVVSIVVLLATGLIIGFGFDAGIVEILGGVALLLLFGFAFSWVFALIGLSVSSPEAANGIGFTLIFPITFISSAFVPVESMPAGLEQVAAGEPRLGGRRRDARAVARGAGRRQRVARRRLVLRDHRDLRAACRREVPPHDRPLGGPKTADDDDHRADELGDGPPWGPVSCTTGPCRGGRASRCADRTPSGSRAVRLHHQAEPRLGLRL